MMHVDCNGVFTLEDYDYLVRLDSLGLAMIEQPMGPDDFLGQASLQRRLETPVCLDESIRSLRRQGEVQV